MSASEAAENPQGVQYVLDILHKRQRDLESQNWIAAEVGRHLQHRLQESHPFLRGAEWQLVGSAAEHLSVSEADDKDLIFTLGPPYTPQFFSAVYMGSGLYQLKWNKSFWNGRRPPHLTSNDYLVVTTLRKQAYDCINSVLENAHISRMKVIKVMLWKQAVRVMLRDTSTKKKHVVDVILQIAGGQWNNMQGLTEWENLPPALQDVITSLETAGQPSISFGLHGPPGTSSLTVTTSYSVLEREFFLEQGNVRDAVLLAKLIISGHNWKNRFGLKGAHVKRLAMKHFMVLRHCLPCLYLYACILSSRPFVTFTITSV
ncbi:uncharacterized protein LOC134781730 [Penaeus indicus]|uniref:uncharacterized protein LOC134781730 n=1 Tax=Penaeus indicus TaxID=29960 RepID=UPI00300C4574